MTKAIVYSSKTGATAKAAQLLAKKLGDAECFDLAFDAPDIEPFDGVIVGGPIRMGKLPKNVASFIDGHREAIQAKPYGLFICCGFADQAEEEIAAVYDEALRASARAVASFGGELDPTKQKGPDKMIVKMVMKASPGTPAPVLDEASIIRFAEDFIGS